jgi:transposase
VPALSSIDAIGDVTTAKVLAYAGDVRRFDSAKAFSAFVGVAPRQKRSGTSIKGRSMMGKGGSNALRHALFMPAMVAIRHNDVVKDLAQRLKAKGLKGKAIIGAAMHKLAHLIYGVLKTQTPYRADWVQRQQAGIEEVQAGATAPA